MMVASGYALETPQKRRERYRDNVRYVFGATADLYYAYWGDFFHLALFDGAGESMDFAEALERTHERYFAAIRGAEASRILDLATGGGAFAAWMAARARGEVVGVDISEVQLARARARLAASGLRNLRFIEHDIMRLDELEDEPFDAAVCLDAACYLPDKHVALRSIATQLRRGARFLLVDWCRSELATGLQEELILEPFYRAWGIPEMETVSGYRRGFEAAGFRLLQVDDLSSRVTVNWERAYRAALSAIADVPSPMQLVAMTSKALRYGPRAVRLAKEQFHAILHAKAGADAGIIRYVSFLAQQG
jgi:ubiquinone/menaquinone biosynthesis C-methylase UbiE